MTSLSVEMPLFALLQFDFHVRIFCRATTYVSNYTENPRKIIRKLYAAQKV